MSKDTGEPMDKFERLMHELVAVPKAALAAEIKKYERQKAKRKRKKKK